MSPVPLLGFGRNGCGFAQEYGIFVEEFRRLPSAPYAYWRYRYLIWDISYQRPLSYWDYQDYPCY